MPDDKTTDKAETKADAAPAAAAQPQIVVNVQQPDRVSEAAQNMIEGQKLRMDFAKDGGRYMVNGVLVDANGEPVKKG